MTRFRLGEDATAPYTCSVDTSDINRFMRLKVEALYDDQNFYDKKEVKVKAEDLVGIERVNVEKAAR